MKPSCDDPIFAFRTIKTLVVLGFWFQMALIICGNLTDYASNFEFVKHVLEMDTIPEDASIQYRSIHSPIVHHAGYITIIAIEILSLLLIAWGLVGMIPSIRRGAVVFQRAQTPATFGVALAYLLWQVIIYAIGNEWFGMWMSKEWNGAESIYRTLMITLGVLIFLHLPEKQTSSSRKTWFRPRR